MMNKYLKYLTSIVYTEKAKIMLDSEGKNICIH